ncbi:hypothetical protein C8R45DRAFT_931850 [Mycena sanguinolenta]|nr:hypothetical protein C8R45DRAFT_931850 [Mycena sanguinolenta]
MTDSRLDFHRDLVRILYDVAVEHSAEIGSSSAARVSVVFGAEVVNVDCDACSVTLRSGEIHTAHAIIGADGARGVVRTTLIEEEGTAQQSDDGLRVALYHATVPKALVDEHGLAVFYHHLGVSRMTVWTGPNRGMRAFVVARLRFVVALLLGNEQDISLFLFTPDICQDSTWTREAETKITDVLGPCDKRGRVLVLGDAAHPFLHGATQAYSVALEDAAFIGKIFTHTKDPARVPEFFRAFPEHSSTENLASPTSWAFNGEKVSGTLPRTKVD